MSRYRIPLYRVSLVREGSYLLEADRPRLSTPDQAARFFRANLQDSGLEQFAAATVDVRHRLTGMYTISVGCLTSSLVHPRETFGPAIVGKAAAIMLCHNHPSGDPEPSAEDMAITRRLAAAGALLGIEVLDHVIIGDGTHRHVSLRERGIL